eukprot:scaffold1400_cov175-Amphora_coffeaeformis.AAC.14
MGSCQSTQHHVIDIDNTNNAKPVKSTPPPPLSSISTDDKRNHMKMIKTAAGNACSGSTCNTVQSHNDTSYASVEENNDSGHSSTPSLSPAKTAPPSMPRSRSRVGLDTMVQERRTQGHLVSNVVHIESRETSSRSIQDIYDGVDNGKVLGEGVAGVVRTVVHKATGLPYAVKVLNLDRLLACRQINDDTTGGGARDSMIVLEQQQEALRNEITIMSQLDHPHIARLQEVYEDDDNIYLVQEVCSGGELFDLLEEQPDYCFDEAEALRKHFQHPGEVQHDMVGTPYTVAPEVIRGNYDEKCDLWAIGVLTYIMLCGEAPFGGYGGNETLLELRQNILRGKFSFDKPDKSVWASVSDEAKDFIRTLLVTDPRQRPSSEQAQENPWIRNYHKATFNPRTTMVNPRLVQSLVNFKELPITQRLMFEVVSFTLMQDQIAHIQAEFEKLDEEGLGELSLESMRLVLSRTMIEFPAGSEDQQENKKGHSRKLSKPEIESVFNHIKMGKSESRVHWHEFVAACLPTCRVDDRNLRIAFDRLDQDHNGFITYEEVVHMIARDADEDEVSLRKAWKDSVEEYGCQQSHFSFEDFCRLIRSFV